MSSAAMVEAKELLELLAKALVDDPDRVEVTEVEEPDELVLELRVAQDDVGKIIGKQGRTVRALRTLIDEWPPSVPWPWETTTFAKLHRNRIWP